MVDDINIIRHILVFQFNAYMLDCLVYIDVGGDRDDLRVHYPCRRVRVKGQQRPQFHGVFGGEVVQKDIAVIFVHFVQNVDGVHGGKNTGGVFRVQIFNNVLCMAFVKFRKGFRRVFRVHVGDHAKLFFKGERFHKLRTVGRVNEVVIQIFGIAGIKIDNFSVFVEIGNVVLFLFGNGLRFFLLFFFGFFVLV